MSKIKQNVSTSAARTALTVKFMSDTLAFTLLVSIIMVIFTLILGAVSFKAATVLAYIAEFIASMSIFFAAMLTAKWAKKRLEIVGDKKISTGINTFAIIWLCINVLNLFLTNFSTLPANREWIFSTINMVVRIIAAISAIKYIAFFEKQNVIPGVEISSDSVKGIVFDWIFAVLFGIGLVIGLISNIFGVIQYNELANLLNNENNIISNEDKEANNANSNVKINTIAEAKALMEKYKFNLELEGEYYYYQEIGDLFAILKTNKSGDINVNLIKNSKAYNNEKYLLKTATFYENTTKYCSYDDVLKTKTKYFGPNATVERKTYINCPNSWFYLEDYDYFVVGEIGCGSGLSLLSYELSVYDFKNIDDTLIIYAKQVHIFGNDSVEEIDIRKDKYTFKLYNDELYLYSVEEIENTSTMKDIK